MAPSYARSRSRLLRLARVITSRQSYRHRQGDSTHVETMKPATGQLPRRRGAYDAGTSAGQFSMPSNTVYSEALLRRASSTRAPWRFHRPAAQAVRGSRVDYPLPPASSRFQHLVDVASKARRRRPRCRSPLGRSRSWPSAMSRAPFLPLADYRPRQLLRRR